MNLICLICRDHLNAKNNACAITCGHLFHEECLSQWSSRATTCPHCRTQFSRKNFHRVYLTISESPNESLDRIEKSEEYRFEDRFQQITCSEGIINDILNLHQQQAIQLNTQSTQIAQKLREVDEWKTKVDRLKAINKNLKRSLRTVKKKTQNRDETATRPKPPELGTFSDLDPFIGTSILVSNVSTLDEIEIKRLFNICGEVTEVKICKDPQLHLYDTAVVCFANKEDAIRALRLNNFVIWNARIEVCPYDIELIDD